MRFQEEKRFQDIAFFQINKAPPPPKRPSPLTIIAITVLITILVLAIGYAAGVRAGAIEPSCCDGAFNFDFDFAA